jgi:hypothetical protein
MVKRKYDFSAFKFESSDIKVNARKFHQQYQGKVGVFTENHNINELKALFTEKNLR